MKKNKANAKRSHFIGSHLKKIADGARTEVEGWLDAAVECRDYYKGNQTEYARASKNDYHTENTMRRYVGACLYVLRKCGADSDASDAMAFLEFTLGYGYGNISDLLSWYGKQDGKRKSRKPQRFSAKREAEKLGKRYTKAQLLEIAKYLKN